MRIFRMTYDQVMGLPMKVFWHLQGSIPRLLADEQKELLELFTSAQDPAASTQLHEALAKLSPQPIKLSGHAIVQMTSQRDEAGFNELRAM
jgi:hypothetical protein